MACSGCSKSKSSTKMVRSGGKPQRIAHGSKRVAHAPAPVRSTTKNSGTVQISHAPSGTRKRSH